MTKTSPKTSFFPLTAALGLVLTLSACGTTSDGVQSSGTLSSGNPYLSGSSNYANSGQVTSIDVLRNRTSGTVGTVAGAAVGGLAGNQIGSGSGRTLATVVGAIGGALVGRAIEQNTQLGEGQEYYRVNVRFNDGSVRYFDYTQPPNVRVGDRVNLENGQLYRM